VILPLFHPAAALYNGSMRETLMADFAKLPSAVQQVTERDKVMKIMAD
jgi:DNA polymerase